MDNAAILQNDVCERARRSRDVRFDGRFFIGVRTTGIYCRPICPANPPRSENVSFFPSAAAASEAGFRPCLRCRPECAPGTPAWAGTSTTVKRGLRLIAEGALDDGDVEALAARLGVTSRHLRRLFAKHVGASPLAVAHTQRLHFAKRLIDETVLPMQAISIAAGFGSVRRFNDTFRNTYGKPPRELRRGRAAQAPGAPLSVRLPYREPYDWQHILGFYANRATPGVERVIDGCYQRTVSVAGEVGSIEVCEVGGALSLTVCGAGTEALFAIVNRVRDMFDVDAPVDDIGARLALDESLSRRLRRIPGVRVPGAWDGWELAVRAILGQQISVKAATTLAGRVAGRYGQCIELEGWPEARLFPRPEQLAHARLEKLGIVGARARTIRELARALDNGEITFDVAQEAQAFRDRLCSIRGIGDWTAQYVAMRVLKDPDAFPASDLGLLRAFDANGRKMRPAELLDRANRWRPWRAYAALLIWSSADGAGG